MNIHAICPSIAVILTNLYREDASLFIDQETILSKEGVLQGDPLAMSMYALAIMPLINELKKDILCQIWYADDSAASGSLSDVREWWNKLNTIDPRYGYFPNSKTNVAAGQGERCQEAEKIFQQSGVNITNSG